MPKKPDDDRIVTLEVVHDPVRAQVIGDVLAQEGIEAIIVGAASGGGVLVGVAAGALDIPIKVRAADAEAAREIIDAMDEFDAVLPDGEDGQMVPAAEMQRRLERLDADEEGEGPYREGPVSSSGRKDSPRLMRVAIPAAIIVPFGGAHFYCRDNRTGFALALTQVLMLSLVMSGDVVAWWGYIGVIAADIFGAAGAAKRFAEERPPDSLREHASLLAAIVLAIGFATPWVLRTAFPVSYLDDEIGVVCDEVGESDCRRRLEDGLSSGRIAPLGVADCARCLGRERDGHQNDILDCSVECAEARSAAR